MKTARWFTGLAAAFLVAATAHAQAPDTVRIGGATKRTVGTVLDLQSGDISCHMELRDDKGVKFTESADFDICTQKPSIKGKRVRLAYKLARVQAASCQGDPDCKKSDTVPLVVSATIIAGAAAAPAAPAPSASQQASFCTPQETVVFACPVGSKLVSVCASRDLNARSGYMQYRFGKPGEPLEMTLPAGFAHPSRAATGENVPFSGGAGTWLRFRNGPVSYVVYSGIGRWGPGGRSAEKQGVVVEKDGKRIASLKCSGKLASELGPVLIEKAGITTRKDEDFEFPD